MSWNRIVERVEAIAPGLLAEFESEYGERRGPDLLDETRRFVAQIGA
jgi:hypothetical protein